MPNATQLQTLEQFVKSAGAGTGGGSLVISTSTTAADVPVPAGHDLVLFIPRPPNPGETVPDLRIGLAGTAHAANLPISGYFPTAVTVAAEGQDISLSSTAAWSVEVVFSKTETGFAT